MVNGKTELVFKGVSPQIDKQSLQVKGEGKFMVLSVSHQLRNLLDKSKQEEITKVEAQKVLIEDKIKIEKNNLLVYKREEGMLLKNQVIGGSYSGIKANNLKESQDWSVLQVHRAKILF